MKAGIVGCGRMGHSHLLAYVELGYQLCWVVDPNISHGLNNIKQYISPEFIYSDVSQLPAHSSVDICSVCTLSPQRTSIASTLVAHDLSRYILLEKPVGLDLTADFALKTLSDQHGVTLAVNHPTRYMASIRYIDSLSDRLGSFSSLYVTGGSFGLVNNGVHIVELFIHMTQSDDYRVQHITPLTSYPSPRASHLTDYDGSFSITTPSGQSLIVNTSSNQSHGLIYVYTFTNGTVSHDALTGEITTNIRDESSRSQPHFRYGESASTSRCVLPTESNTQATISVINSLLSTNDYPTFQSSLLASDLIRSLVHPRSQRMTCSPHSLVNTYSDPSFIANWA